MKSNTSFNQRNSWPTLSNFPTPAKALVTAIIVILSIAMTGASQLPPVEMTRTQVKEVRPAV
jgi:hypothetical protein